MKLSNIKYFICCFILLFLVEGTFYPQVNKEQYLENSSVGFPIITNYLPKDYKAHNQNWAIVKDVRGVMYFGNSAGVLEFDGQNWDLIKIPNSIVRSMAIDDNGNVFIGSADDFGYLTLDKNSGKKKYISLISLLPTKEAFGHIWHTFYVDKSIFFISKTLIFQFIFDKNNLANPKVNFWKSNSRYKIAHCVNKKLYVLDQETGLLLFDNGSFKTIPGSEIFLTSSIYTMLPYDDFGNKILIATKSAKLFLYDGNSFSHFNTEAEEFLLKNNIYLPGSKLPEGSFVFNTSKAGIVIINRNGNIVRKIDMKTGLPDDGVLYSFYSENKLWLALQNGISAIDLPSPVTFLNQNAGLKGSISDLKIFNNNLYAASTAGIFKLSLNPSHLSNPQFSEISNIANEGWQFIKFKDKILVALTDGVYQVNESGLSKISSKWRGCYTIFNSAKLPNRVYAGLENGLAVLDFDGTKWIDRGMVNKINAAVRYIEEDKDGNIWLGTSYNGVYKLSDLAIDFKNQPTIKHFSKEVLIPNDELKIFKSKIGLLYCTRTKVLIFDEKTETFAPEKLYGLNDFLGEAEIFYVLQDEDENFWVSAVKNSTQLHILFGSKTKNGVYKWRELSFLKSVIDFSNSNAVFSIFKDKNTIWFSGADGVVSLDSRFLSDSMKDSSSFYPMIRKVTVNRDSLIFSGDDLTKSKLGLESIFKLSSNVTLIRFDFSSMTYEDELASYQFKLDGFDDDWSEWTIEHRKDYTNLSPGNYKFRVKAKNIFDVVSQESTFEFRILAPWYQSWWAYLIYLVLFITAILLLINYRLKYLEQKNIKLEALVSDRTKQIKEQAEKLKEMDELKSRFFANISHEFRTPLTLILGQIESVQSFISDLKLKNKLQMGYRNARRLERLINQLLEISKIEAGKDKLKISRLNIAKYLKNIFYSFESIADKKNIRLEFETEKEFVEVFVDWEKIEKVFNNLLNNAIKFTENNGSLTLKISINNSLENNSAAKKSFVTISLSDTGIGISEDKLPHIFDRFYQVDRKKISDAEGSGIGLALAKELVELHSGSISVISKERVGTTFTVKLPLGEEHLKESNYEISDENESDILVLQKNNEMLYENDVKEEVQQTVLDEDLFSEVILVIDDNHDIREFISEHLEVQYNVVQASDGRMGIEKAKKIIPDLIVSDIMMPFVDGYELSHKLKNDPLTSHIPIIILTAKAGEDDKMTGLETGADDYLIKPFSSKELLVRVKNLINNRKLLRQKFSTLSEIKPEMVSQLSLDQQFLQKVMESIKKNIANPNFSVEQLADDVAFSVSQLNRKLKALIDQSAGQYIRTIRLEKAGQLIKSKAATVKEIAYQVGFTEQSNFTKSFKKHFGVTPSEFLNEPLN